MERGPSLAAAGAFRPVIPGAPPRCRGARRDGRPVGQIDTEAVVRATETWSGADLAHLVDQATRLALESSIDAGKVQPISDAHFRAALHDMTPSTAMWFDTAMSAARYSDDPAYKNLGTYAREHNLG